MVAASPVTDAMRFTGHLEKAYRDIWIQWCGESTGDAIEHEADRNSAEAESIHDRQTIFPLPIESCKIYREKTDVLKDCSFIICSMLTPGERYYRNADRLADSCEKYSLPYRISEMPAVHTSISLQGTEDLAYTKANFIASSMEQFPGKNILYLDADLLFVDYPARIREISDAQYDFAVYNWLSDKHNEAYIPFVNRESHEPHDSQCYIYSHHVEYYCTDQLVCSGGVQFWRNSPGVRRFLEQWQNMIALTPSTVDDRCLDYAYNNLDTVEFPLRVAWLDKPYLRMPWWPHVKPVILHLGMPNAELRCPTEINGRKHFYPEWCEKKGEPLYFPAGYIIDAKKKLLAKVENSGIVTTQPIQNEFWIYPEEK